AAGAIEQPKYRWIEQFFIAARKQSMRHEAGPRSAFHGGLFIDMSLEQKTAGTNAADPLQRMLRVSQVIEHSVEQNQIERAEPPGFKIIDIHQEGRCVGLARGFDNIKAP